MTIKKKNKVLWAVICLVSILAVGTIVVRAFSNNSTVPPTTLIENAGGVTINNPVQPIPDNNLGAVVDPTSLPALICSNDNCVYTAQQTFIDASTTIASIQDPFLAATSTVNDVVLDGTTNDFGYGYTGATTTIDLVRLNITGVATSTFYVGCAAAPNAYATSTISYNIIASGVVATSTEPVIENNIATAYQLGVGGGSVAKIMLGPSLPYLICKVWSADLSADVGGFTGDSNTFDGVITVRFNRTRF